MEPKETATSCSAAMRRYWSRSKNSGHIARQGDAREYLCACIAVSGPNDIEFSGESKRVRCNEGLERSRRWDERWVGREEKDACVNGRAEEHGLHGKATAHVRKDPPKCVDDERNVEEGGRDGAR